MHDIKFYQRQEKLLENFIEIGWRNSFRKLLIIFRGNYHREEIKPLESYRSCDNNFNYHAFPVLRYYSKHYAVLEYFSKNKQVVRISGEEESLENVTFENRIATDSIERAYLLYTARKSWLSYLVSYSTRYAVQPTTRSDGVLGPRATPEGTRGRVERDLSTWVVHSPYACII